MDLREKVALAHQIIALWGMDDATYTHISCRDGENFYLSPFGLLFEEVEYNNLVKINIQNGSVTQDSDYKIYNPTGLMVHGAIYKVRGDIGAVIHLHTSSTIVISSMKKGLLPISQHALHFYDKISYHDYDSMLLDEKVQAQKISEDLGKNNVMFLRNHGFIACGKTIQEALFYTYHLERACQIQVLLNLSLDEYILPEKHICKKACDELLSFEKDLGARDFEAWKRKLNRNKLNLN
jgi:ribulose-5-phosphate 4-epimerase/fuculose-1-phosphate aldolase